MNAWTGHRNPGAGRTAGFTLVEVMVALTVLSLIMLATVTGLRTLANTQVALERVTDRVDEVRTVSTFLRNTFESAILANQGSRLTLGGSPAGKNFFVLQKDSVAWKSTVLFGETYGGSYLIRVAREGDELVMRWQEPAARGVADDWDKASSRVLVRELEAFELAYRQGYGSGWVEEIDRNVIPDLLRMRIKSSGRYWPDLVLRVARSR
jgi:general secretion pathway protein J